MAPPTQLPADVDPAEPRQHHVEQHDVGLNVVEPLHGFESVGHGDDTKPLSGQPDRQSLDEAGLVLDDEDDGLRRHAGPSGRRIVKTEPSPSCDWTVTSPE